MGLGDKGTHDPGAGLFLVLLPVLCLEHMDTTPWLF